ncbi:MAG: DUF1905 domain-containing protein [Phycisphaerales bacterium]|nr:MAG: DUF1905 domain-containing protein [Phycisphaerales bacterium]
MGKAKADSKDTPAKAGAAGAPKPASRTFTTTIIKDDDTSMCAIEVPFDPKEVFGKVRAPVRVSIKGHEYRSTISSMGGCWWVPLRTSNREAAGVKAGDTVRVMLASDESPRVVTTPRDLSVALKAAGAGAAWQAMSYTHQREHVEAIVEAKKEETRARRVEKAVDMVLAWQAARGGGAGVLKTASAIASNRATR